MRTCLALGRQLAKHFLPNFRSAVGGRVAGFPLAGLPIGQVLSVKRNGTVTAKATSFSDELDRMTWILSGLI